MTPLDPDGERHPYRWVIFSAMAGVYCSFGVVVTAIPPMVTEVRTDLGIGRGAMGFALGAWALVFIVTAPPAGRIIDRIGLRWSLTIGAAFIAASGLARAAAQGLGTMWLAIAIFGIGGPLVSTSAPKLAVTWFDDLGERRLAVGIYAAAPAMGSILVLALTNAVLLPWLGGWRAVLVADAVFAVLAGMVWFVVATLAPSPPIVEQSSAVSMRAATGALLADPGFRVAITLGIGTFFVNHALSAWMPDALAQQVGWSSSTASNWVAASLVLGVFANMIIPRFASDARRTTVLGIVMMTLAAALIVAMTAPGPVAAPAALLSGVRSVLVPLVILVLMSAETVHQHNMGAANGLWFAFAEMGGTSGPVVIGAVSDTGAGFTGAMTLLASVLVGLTAMLAVEGRRRGRPRLVGRAAARPTVSS